MKENNSLVVGRPCVATDNAGKEHRVTVLDKGRQNSYGKVVTMYLCAKSDGTTFWTNNIKDVGKN